MLHGNIHSACANEDRDEKVDIILVDRCDIFHYP